MCSRLSQPHDWMAITIKSRPEACGRCHQNYDKYTEYYIYLWVVSYRDTKAEKLGKVKENKGINIKGASHLKQ